jgi:hypothetical protein
MKRLVAEQSSKAVFMASISAILLMAFSHLASAAIVYENSSNFLGPRSFTSGQLGDEITLAGTERTVIELHIGVSMQGHSGTADFQAWIYANDGPGGEPGTMLWASELMQTVPLTGAEEFIVFDVPNIAVPDTFTWTLQNSNATPVEVGLPYYNPPSIGSSPDYGWHGHGTSPWFKLPAPHYRPANYMARVVAVPEPTSILILAFGTLTLRRRSKQ